MGNYSSYCRCVKSVRTSNGKSKGKGTVRTETNISPGRMWRQRTMRKDTARVIQYYQNKTARIMESLLSRLLATNLHGHHITLCGTRLRMTPRGYSAGKQPVWGWNNHWSIGRLSCLKKVEPCRYSWQPDLPMP